VHWACPKWVLDEADKYRRHCPWRDKDSDKKNPSLAAWDLVCQPKSKGGLGILGLKVQNQGLLMKFLHNFFNKHDVPWVMLVWEKYYQDGAPHTKKPCGSFWWRDVSSLFDIYRGVTKCSVNIGDTVLLWKDCWMGDIIPQYAFPHLFSFALNEDCSVMQYTERDQASRHLFLPMSVEAGTALDELHTALARTERVTTSPDQWSYVWGQSVYHVKKYYDFFFREVIPNPSLPLIWKTKCVMKQKVFAWLLMMDRLNTRDMLCRRQCPIPDVNCVVCQQVRETRDHLFFDCTLSTSCWSILGIQWDQSLELSERITMAANSWRGPFFLEYVIIGAWNIWKQRNRKHFDGVTPNQFFSGF
jgi:hypothetical protein